MEFGPFARDLRGSQLLRPHSTLPGYPAAQQKDKTNGSVFNPPVVRDVKPLDLEDSPGSRRRNFGGAARPSTAAPIMIMPAFNHAKSVDPNLSTPLTSVEMNLTEERKPATEVKEAEKEEEKDAEGKLVRKQSVRNMMISRALPTSQVQVNAYDQFSANPPGIWKADGVGSAVEKTDATQDMPVEVEPSVTIKAPAVVAVEVKELAKTEAKAKPIVVPEVYASIQKEPATIKASIPAVYQSISECTSISEVPKTEVKVLPLAVEKKITISDRTIVDINSSPPAPDIKTIPDTPEAEIKRNPLSKLEVISKPRVLTIPEAEVAGPEIPKVEVHTNPEAEVKAPEATVEVIVEKKIPPAVAKKPVVNKPLEKEVQITNTKPTVLFDTAPIKPSVEVTNARVPEVKPAEVQKVTHIEPSVQVTPTQVPEVKPVEVPNVIHIEPSVEVAPAIIPERKPIEVPKVTFIEPSVEMTPVRVPQVKPAELQKVTGGVKRVESFSPEPALLSVRDKISKFTVAQGNSRPSSPATRQKTPDTFRSLGTSSEHLQPSSTESLKSNQDPDAKVILYQEVKCPPPVQPRFTSSARASPRSHSPILPATTNELQAPPPLARQPSRPTVEPPVIPLISPSLQAPVIKARGVIAGPKKPINNIIVTVPEEVLCSEEGFETESHSSIKTSKTFKTDVNGGLSKITESVHIEESHIEKSMFSTEEDEEDDEDFNEAVAAAIRKATEINPNLTVQKIEVSMDNNKKTEVISDRPGR
jgi:hypothetical protein